MKKAFFLAAPALLALGLASGTTLLAGCGGGSGGGTGGGSGGGGGGGGGSGDPNFTCDANPNAETAATVFNKIVMKTDNATGCDGCHVANQQGYPYGDYTTASAFYTTNVGVASILAPSLKKVAANDLAHSTMWIKLVCAAGTTNCKAPDGTSVGAAMPYQATAQLSAADLKVFKDWICKGAPQQ